MSLLECVDCPKPTPINRLDVSVSHFEDNDLEELTGLERLKNLEHLCLRDSYRFDDNIALVIASTLKDLRFFAAPACNISGFGVKRLVSELPSLRFLDFDRCLNISGDAIEWTRAQGVRIQHRLHMTGFV